MRGYSTEHELQREKISITEVLRIMELVVTWLRKQWSWQRRGTVFFQKEV